MYYNLSVRKKRVALWAVLLSLSGAVLYVWPQKAWAMPKRRKRPPVVVKVVQAKKIAWHKRLAGIGTLKASQSVLLKAGITGHVTHIYFKEGAYVKKDTLLLELDHDRLSANLAEAKSQAKLNDLTYQRSKRLLRTKAISKAEFDAAKAALDISYARIEQIKDQLDKKFITAPFSGHLGLRHISIGDYVASDDVLVLLNNTDPIYVDFGISSVYLPQLAEGQVVCVIPQTHAGKKFCGSILALDSQIDEQTRSIMVRGTLKNSDYVLKPGAFVDVSVITGEIKWLISVPQEAIVKSPEQDNVYKVEKGVAVKVPVVVVHRDHANVLIAKGLLKGDTVVVEGQLKLINGSRVIVNPS